MPSFSADLPVRLALPAAGVARERLAPRRGRWSFASGGADRHIRIGRVRNAQQPVLELLVELAKLVLALVMRRPSSTDSRLELGDLRRQLRPRLHALRRSSLS